MIDPSSVHDPVPTIDLTASVVDIEALQIDGVPLDDLRAPARGHAVVPSPLSTRPGDRPYGVLARLLVRLGAATDLASAASAVEVCVPAVADFAEVQLLDGVIHGEDVARLVPGARLSVRAPVRHGAAFRPARSLSVGSALREAMEGRRVVRRLPSGPRPPPGEQGAPELDHDPAATAARDGDLLAIPLSCGGLTLGVLALLRGPERPPWQAEDVETVEQVAAVTALRLENLRLAARQAVTSSALRHTLLPRIPAVLAGVDLGARYRAARPGDGVGGDWLEVVPLPGGRTALSVGDVMGHGLQAAVIMGVLRSAIRALAPLHLEPAQLLRQLDDLAVQHQADRPQQANWLATCLYAVYDPVTRQCEVASAGHLPPVLTGVDGTSMLVGVRPGTPLGVGAGRFRTSRLTIPDGSQLILYTDGLVEVRGEDIERGMAGLCLRASAGLRRPLDALCQELVDQVGRSDRPDDVALLVARFRGLPSDRVATWTLTADPQLAGHAGWLARRVLQRWELDGVADAVVPFVDELVAEVVDHGVGPVTLRLLHTGALLCEVSDASGYLPTERDDGAARGPGRWDGGAARWGSYRTAVGKVVWWEYPLPG